MLVVWDAKGVRKRMEKASTVPSSDTVVQAMYNQCHRLLQLERVCWRVLTSPAGSAAGAGPSGVCCPTGTGGVRSPA